jgi:hypothetical protein
MKLVGIDGTAPANRHPSTSTDPLSKRLPFRLVLRK